MQYSSLEMIEYLRQQLYLLAETRELTDPEVVEVSQQLDRLLNQYCYLSDHESEMSAA